MLDIVEEERQKGTTVIMITHHMEEVERLCDRVLLLKDGRAVVYGRTEDIKDQAGNNIIRITFNGQIPDSNEIYTISNQTKTTAELSLREGKTAKDVLESLVDQGVDIRQYSVERPSLDDIFVNIYGAKLNHEGEIENA